MLSEKCVFAVLSRGVTSLARSGTVLEKSEKMSAISVRTPGLQTAASVLDTRALRLRGMSTLEGVRRNLFGCADREESRKFAERELARQLESDSQRWGFDFANERPLPGTQRFAWQLVPATAVPAALRRAAITSPKPISPSEEPTITSPDTSKTQKRITDFLKPRKRLTNAAKKSSPGKHDGAHLRPPKVARLQQHYKRAS